MCLVELLTVTVRSFICKSSFLIFEKTANLIVYGEYFNYSVVITVFANYFLSLYYFVCSALARKTDYNLNHILSVSICCKRCVVLDIELSKYKYILIKFENCIGFSICEIL